MKTAFRIPEDDSYHHPLSAKSLDALMERIGDAHYVLLGEASHGTHEFYTWRTQISKRLIREKGFSFIAVEGDWPDCYKINRHVKGYYEAGEKILDILNGFDRWPTWMWANWEIAALAEWLREHNMNIPHAKKIGFYGLDVYSLWESMDAMIKYLSKEDPIAARAVIRAIQCFEPYREEGQEYALASFRMSANCTEEVINVLKEIRSKARNYDHDREASLNTEQNAYIAVNAEKYYRAMISFGPESWNIRDTHMVETLNRIMNFHGPEAKAIVWEHNTHIGDARATNMKEEGTINVGQLIREEHSKEDVVAVGFGSYEGTVIAGVEWGSPMEEMKVPEARKGSIEEILHKEFGDNKLLILNREIDKKFQAILPHRAIGVVYHPYREWGNYVPTVLAERYDAFIYLEKTKALHPLHIKPNGHITPETYPFGV
jgi:erythromycin esterase